MTRVSPSVILVTAVEIAEPELPEEEDDDDGAEREDPEPPGPNIMPTPPPGWYCWPSPRIMHTMMNMGRSTGSKKYITGSAEKYIIMYVKKFICIEKIYKNIH